MSIKRWVWAVAIFLVLYILLQLWLYFVIIFFASDIFSYTAFFQVWSDTGKISFLILVQSLIFLFFLYLVYTWRKKPSQKNKNILLCLRKRRQRKWWIPVRNYVFGSIIIFFAFNLVLSWVLWYFNIEIPGLYGEQMVMTMLQGISVELRREKIVIFVFVVLFAPLVEEIIWRGFVTDRLMKYRQGQGVFLAALLFAVAHMEWWVIRNLVILACFLGYIYRKTKSLRYSFFFHIIINGLAMIVVLMI